MLKRQKNNNLFKKFEISIFLHQSGKKDLKVNYKVKEK